MESALQNWSRWIRSREHSHAQCYSIEGRFRRKSRADDTPTGYGDWLTTPPTQIMPPVDIIAAAAVDRIMHRVPKRPRVAIFLHYVHHMPRQIICRRLAIRFNEWTAFMDSARLMVENLLTSGRKRQIIREDHRYSA